MTGKYRCYFPGGNTPEGFFSYYGDIMPQKEAGRIFCIKGGPGTGKSTLMRRIGSYYLQKGMDVDLLKCSSDPASLDGIVIKDKNIAIIDGTAPHVTDPINPGAVDEIINLGEHFDDEELTRNRDEIIALSSDISETFQYAYVYLKCADIIYRHMNRLLSKYISEENLYDFITSVKLPGKINIAGKRKRYFGSSITSSGMINELPGLSKEIRDIYLIETPIGYKPNVTLNFLSQIIVNEGYDVEELYCPMYPAGTAEHIISPDAGIGVFTCNDFHSKELFEENNVRKIIKVDTVSITDNDRERLEFLKKEAISNIENVTQILKNAKKKHDVLEKHYIKAMDFASIEEVKNKVIEKIEQSTV